MNSGQNSQIKRLRGEYQESVKEVARGAEVPKRYVNDPAFAEAVARAEG